MCFLDDQAVGLLDSIRQVSKSEISLLREEVYLSFRFQKGNKKKGLVMI